MHGDAQEVQAPPACPYHWNSGHTWGDVFAGKIACEKNREVKLYTRRPDADRRLAATTTTGPRSQVPHFVPAGRSEKWIRAPSRPFKYFAVVTRERKHGYVCTQDKSRVKRIVTGE